MRRLLITASVVCAIACGRGSEPIVLSIVGPFSQPRGKSMLLAAQLAVDQINARDGINGRALTLDVYDDSADAGVAIRAAHRLYQDVRVVAVIGHLNSTTTNAAANIYNGGEAPLVSITPSASAPHVPLAGKYTFRVCPSDEVHGAQLAQWVWAQLGLRRAVIFYQNDDYGRGVRSTFTAQFENAGGQLIDEYPYMQTISDFGPYAEHATRLHRAEAIMIAGSRRESEQIVTALRQAGSTGVIVGPDGLSGIETMGEAAAGVYISAAWLPDQPGAANGAFLEAYARAYGGARPDHRGAAAYDSVNLLARTIEAVGPDRERIQRYLAGVGSSTPAFEGVTGSITFDEHGDVVGKQVAIGVVRNGRLVAAESP